MSKTYGSSLLRAVINDTSIFIVGPTSLTHFPLNGVALYVLDIVIVKDILI